MASRRPLVTLSTHSVENQVPPLDSIDLFGADTALVEGVRRGGAAWATERLKAFGDELGSARVIDLGFEANRHPPELRSFDRYGQRIDEVVYHPAYHDLMRLGIDSGMPSIAWTEKQPGGHVAHVAMTYLFSQIEAGVVCPMTMTYAVLPALRQQSNVTASWEEGVLQASYDERCAPAAEKTGLTFGMAMTEKQGGSDVRANSTRAQPLGAGGPGGEYELRGHKWFCSAPMSDAFLTLAQTDRGLSCFLVPRWRPDGSRNPFCLQRLKDKLGNRSNASSEVEYDGTWSQMIGEEGRGVRTIFEMVHHTRNDTVAAPAAFMRQALVQAIHHAMHRNAFGKRLVEQPLMQNVLADLAIESEAATVLSMRIAQGFDNSTGSDEARAFTRIATAVAKYWLNKRAPGHVAEALECLGGAGYVEESMMPRLYREAPLNGIWEGSGNVICLDVLRALGREPRAFELFLAEVREARGGDRRLDAAVEDLEKTLSDSSDLERRARQITESMAIVLQASLLVRYAPSFVADAFCGARLGGEGGFVYGTLPASTAVDEIIARAWPA
ncbi:MAG: acyl-CoA dehydrogenase family protein [Candidatus Binatia bacterium]|nr:acyl-CoA dehydrogenase family protein [Candidatus Binatia bacterium]